MTKERNELSDTRMLEVLKMSDLQDWVKSLPEGLETQMGSLGVIASGGQAQRIGLARAFFVNPKILILDEATSAIDYESEEKIRQTLERVKGTMTVLTIAHRLSTVKSSDLIIIMQDGTITAQGDFQSLTNHNEYFKNILKSLIQ
jgi:ATP-binding cassette subfamily C protein